MPFFEFILFIALMTTIGGIINNYIGHRQKIAELKLKGMEQADQSVVSELRALQQQVAELRDTTTRYDVSFDSALQRLETRVGSVEHRLHQVETERVTAPANRS